MKQTIRRAIHRLTLGACRAGQHKLSDICVQCGLPEALTDGKQRSLNPWMADQTGLMPPLKDFRAQRSRNQQPARRAPPRHVHPSTGLLYSLFDTPRKSPDHHHFRNDGFGCKLPLWGPEQARESVGRDILGPRYKRVKLNRPKKCAQQA